MRVYLTGSRGFVGSRLCPRLEAAGHLLTACDREVDITQASEVDESIRAARPEAVIHLAAQSSVALSLRDPLGCYRTNYIGSKNLLDAVARHAPEARVLLIGSGDLYAPSSEGAPPYTEDALLKPRSPYARSKAAAEQLGALAADAGLDVVRLRPFNHTGPGQPPIFVIPDFARQVAGIAHGLRPAAMRVGNLASTRDFLHVDDVIDAYLRLLERPEPRGLFNISRGKGISIQEVLDRLCALAGVAPTVEIDPERFRPTDWLVGDSSRLRAATGWAPQIGFDALLQELLDDWLAKPESELR